MAEVWPEVAKRLTALLRRRGVLAADAEDIIQEVAARVVARQISFESCDDLFRWAATVARNLDSDHRRAGRRLDDGPLEDGPCPLDVASIVEQRATLDALSRRWRRLAVSDREAITSGFAHASANRQEQVRLAVRRHRARARLVRMMDGLVGVLGALWGGRRVLKGAPPTAVRVATVAVPVAIMVTLLPSLSAPPAPPLGALPESARPAGRPPTAPDGGAGVLPPVNRAPEARPHHVPNPPAAPATPPATVPPPPPADGPSNETGEDPLERQVEAETLDGRKVSGKVEDKKEDDHLLCLESALLPSGTCLDNEEPPAAMP